MSEFETVIVAHGPDGNIFYVLSVAVGFLKRLNRRDEAEQLMKDVLQAGSYEDALAFIERWFPVDRGE